MQMHLTKQLPSDISYTLRQHCYRAVRIAGLTILFVTIAMSILGVVPAENINHKATLNWIAPVGKYTGINLYRQDCSSGNYVLLKSLGKVTTTVDQAVIGGETYSYYLTTTYQGNESNPSKIVTATVPY